MRRNSSPFRVRHISKETTLRGVTFTQQPGLGFEKEANTHTMQYNTCSSALMMECQIFLPVPTNPLPIIESYSQRWLAVDSPSLEHRTSLLCIHRNFAWDSRQMTCPSRRRKYVQTIELVQSTESSNMFVPLFG